MQPVLHPEIVVFCVLPEDVPLASVPALGMFRESEGITVIVPERLAALYRLQPVFRAACLTLSAQTDLQAVGITAAVSSALAMEGIACNVVAAVHHDHLFVPAESGEAALAVLVGLFESTG
jgi:uncharacterized protein